MVVHDLDDLGPMTWDTITPYCGWKSVAPVGFPLQFTATYPNWCRLIGFLTRHHTGRKGQRGHTHILSQGLAVAAAALAARLPEMAVVLGLGGAGGAAAKIEMWKTD